MQILSLELENVKSYAHARVEFAPGVNAIVGRNGAGKSTILEAIGFALFDAKAYNSAQFVREGARTAVVTVAFLSAHDERRYEVVRRAGSSGIYYIFDPEMQTRICTGAADVMAFIRKHAGVDGTTDMARLFNDTLGVPQGTLTAIFLETPVTRKSVFDRLLKVEEYRTAFERLKEGKDLLREQRAEVEQAIAAQEGELRRLPVLQEEAARLDGEIAQASEELDAFRRRLEGAQAVLAALETARSRVAEARTARERSAQAVAVQEAHARNRAAALAEAEAAHALVVQHSAGHDAYLGAMKRRQELEGRGRARAQQQAQLAAAEREAALAQQQADQYARELNEIKAAADKVVSLAAAVQRQAALESALAAARERVGELARAQQEAAARRSEAAQGSARLEDVRAQVARFAALEEEQAALEATVAATRTERNSLVEQQASFKVQADALKEQTAGLAQVEGAKCPVCEQELTPAHRAGLIERNQQRLEALREEYRRINDEVKQNDAALAGGEARLRAIGAELRTLARAAEADELGARIAQASAAADAAQARADALAGAPDEAAAHEEALRGLGNPREENALAAARAAERPRVEAELERVGAALAAAEERCNTLRAGLEQYATLDGDMSATEAELQRFASAYQTVLAHRQAAEALPRRQADAAETRAALEQAQEGLAAADEALRTAAAAFDEGEFTRALEEERTLRADAGERQGRLAMRSDNLKRMQAEIAHLEAVQGKLAAAQRQRDELSYQEETLEAVRRVLRDAGPHVTAALIAGISDEAAQIFGELVNDHTRRLRWTEDYGIVLEVDGHRRSFEQLSGGEQMSAALAVRLALLRALSQIDLAFFDEPTAHLDEQRREALARQITNVRGMQQMFIISHDDTFEQLTSRVIRVEKADGVSRVN